MATVCPCPSQQLRKRRLVSMCYLVPRLREAAQMNSRPNDRLYYFDQLNTIIKNIQLTITDSPLCWEGSLCSPSIYHDNNESFQQGQHQYCPCQEAGAPTSAPRSPAEHSAFLTPRHGMHRLCSQQGTPANGTTGTELSLGGGKQKQPLCKRWIQFSRN